jgi:hypothetical protein
MPLKTVTPSFNSGRLFFTAAFLEIKIGGHVTLKLQPADELQRPENVRISFIIISYADNQEKDLNLITSSERIVL